MLACAVAAARAQASITPRQPSVCPTSPASAPPATCPPIAQARKRLIATCRSAIGTLSPKVASASGVMPPAAAPARTRATKSMGRLVASAPKASARTSRLAQRIMTSRLPSASPMGPRMGWISA